MLDSISLSLGGIAGADGSSEQARNSLQTTYSQFLTLLTTQLKNQDPLNPMESNEFTNQLIQMANVEQSISQTDKMNELLVINQAATVNGALRFIGMEVDYVGGDMEYEGNPVNIKYSLSEDSTKTRVSVLNADDQVVYSVDGNKTTGGHNFIWDGKDNDGNVVAPGKYRVEVGAQDKDGKAVETFTIVPSKVKGVETVQGQVFLIIGDQKVPIGAVQAVREATQAVVPNPNPDTNPDNNNEDA